jgi:drug/metabolite transporter (DMT)-like permease
MNENFWVYLSFIVMIIVSLKVIILTYITSLDVDNVIVMAFVFIFIGLFSLLYIIVNKYETLNFIKKCNTSIFSIIILTAVTISLQYTIMPTAYGMSPNPALCGTILNLNVILVLILSYFLFKTEINMKNIIGIIISIIGLVLILNN